MSDADLESRGAVIGTRLADGTRTIRIPVSRFAALRDVPGLTRITASYRCRKVNDVSVPLSGATPGSWTHSGSGVFAGNAGANVILGEVDSGIDWSHDDFKHPDGTSRILFLWDQAAAGTPPSGYGYGTEWTAAQINGGTCTHHDTDGHGTHVMGSAAGDGSATGNGQPAYRFIGMAPEAGIIVVATDFSIAHIIDGTSQTVLVGERAWGFANGTWSGAPNNALVRAGQSNPWQFATATSPVFVLVHNNWINILTDSDGGLDDFSSYHTGGVQLLFADGSVRFIANITNDGPLRRAFWGMGTRAGREVIQGLE
jgi:prepilin-type processing-associated H-X9-DG protein